MTNLKCAPEVSEDPILGLMKTFSNDSRLEKMDLLAGVLRRNSQLWCFDSVRDAQVELIKKQLHKGYLPIEGRVEFLEQIALLLGIESYSWQGIQTIGGTGALNLAAQLLKSMGIDNIYMSQPTWPNHPRIFGHAQLNVLTYRYPFSEEYKADFLQTMHASKASAFLLHACCHNPTGIDFDMGMWRQCMEIAKEYNHCLVIDMAYQGLKDGLWQDAAPVRMALELDVNVLVCYSCAKNFTLYGERAGALFVKFKDSLLQSRAMKYLSHLARASYSNPPMNCALLVTLLLNSKALKITWENELEQARLLLLNRRKILAQAFAGAGFESLAESIVKQSGMFAYFPISQSAVDWLRQERAIYLPKEGRINLTSVNDEHMGVLMDALKEAFLMGV